jgi:hypothetical protein
VNVCAESGRRDFFISRIGADRAWAEWIAWQLEAAGYTTVVQDWDFAPAQNFIGRMAEGLDTAEHTIAVLSDAYFRSPYCKDEWTGAFLHDQKSRHRLLTVRVEDCQLPRLLATRLYIDLVGLDEQTATANLLDGIRRALGQRGKPATPPPYPVTVAGTPRFPGRFPTIWNVPARNRNFTGRDGLIEQLRASLGAQQTTAVVQTSALHGLGGIGKTALAIEYAHRYASHYELIWWIVAEQPASITAALATLGAKLGVPTAANQEEVIAELWEHLRGHDRWLLIFDNAGSPAMLEGYRPPAGAGQVLITSRNPAWGGLAAQVAVDTLDRDEAVAFLVKRTGNSDTQAADELAEQLGDLPLALEQAASYIDQTPGMGLDDYLRLFRHRRDEVLTRGQPTAYHGTVDTTWRLSFDRVATASPAAAMRLPRP